MAKTLYLHVGMPKCASTTIQGVLRAHAEVFAEHGKFYGVPPQDRTEGQGNVTSLLADMRAKRRGKVKRALTFFLERDSDVIMSSEMFIGLARNDLSDDLIAQAAEAGFDTRLICYVRRQDQWIESDFKQHIKGGSDWTGSIDELIAQRTKTRVLNYHWLLENWNRSLPREAITVVPLRSGQDELYPLERFLTFLDMDPALAGDLAMPRQNVSPPTGLIEPMRYLKRGLIAREVKPGLVPRHLHRFLKLAPERIAVPQRRFLLPLVQREELLARFARSNAALSADYLGGAQVFDTEVRPEPEELAPLAQEAAEVLAAWILSDPEQLALDAEDTAAAQAEEAAASRGRWWPLRRG